MFPMTVHEVLVGTVATMLMKVPPESASIGSFPVFTPSAPILKRGRGMHLARQYPRSRASSWDFVGFGFSW